MSINSINISGRLGNDPENRLTAHGKARVSFRLAVREYNSQSQQEETKWFSAVCYKSVAQRALKLLSSGDFVTIRGKLDTYDRSVQIVDKQTGAIKDVKIARTEIVVQDLDFDYKSLKKVINNQVSTNTDPSQYNGKTQVNNNSFTNYPAQNFEVTRSTNPGTFDDDDDIPF